LKQHFTAAHPSPLFHLSQLLLLLLHSFIFTLQLGFFIHLFLLFHFSPVSFQCLLILHRFIIDQIFFLIISYCYLFDYCWYCCCLSFNRSSFVLLPCRLVVEKAPRNHRRRLLLLLAGIGTSAISYLLRLKAFLLGLQRYEFYFILLIFSLSLSFFVNYAV
jgi:hypothetical protein